jgi:hypothetical protein
VVNAARDRLDEAAAGTIAMRERTGKPHPLGRCTADDLWQIRESLLGHFDGNALAAMEQPGPHENEEDLLLALAIVDEEIERRDWPS